MPNIVTLLIKITIIYRSPYSRKCTLNCHFKETAVYYQTTSDYRISEKNF